MTRDQIRTQLQDVFREVFQDDAMQIEDQMTANDVDGWDSLMHVNLIIALERLQIKFAAAEISRLTEPDQNIGTLLDLVVRKRSKPA